MWRKWTVLNTHNLIIDLLKLIPLLETWQNNDALSKWAKNDGVFNRTADNYTSSLTRNINSEMREIRNNTFISPTRVSIYNSILIKKNLI